VKTALIEGKQPSKIDGLLLDALDLVQVPAPAIRSEASLIGVRNELGDTYRAIGVTGTENFVDVMAALHLLGYKSAAINDHEVQQGFDAVVCTPGS